MVLWYKKLDRGLFERPCPERAGDFSVQISETGFEALFAGLPTQGRQLH
jgi:hypothetical protein